MERHQVLLAQLQLHGEGFYKGDLDGFWGPKTQAAYEAFKKHNPVIQAARPTPAQATAKVEVPASPQAVQKDDGILGNDPRAIVRSVKARSVMASSFADPADVAAFKRCKAQGKTDQECFKVGDNGIGKWGDDTTANVAMCALPPEDWEHLGSKARGARVLVTANKRSVVAELRDTMPRKANIKNGAGIDLNPAAVAALGLKPPIMVPATWEWV